MALDGEYRGSDGEPVSDGDLYGPGGHPALDEVTDRRVASVAHVETVATSGLARVGIAGATWLAPKRIAQSDDWPQSCPSRTAAHGRQRESTAAPGSYPERLASVVRPNFGGALSVSPRPC